MYINISPFIVQRVEDGVFIPRVADNPAYLEFLEWEILGGKPIEPPSVSTTQTRFSVREYINRFTLEEQITIREAQFTDMEVGLVYDDLNRAQFIDVEDPDVAAGIDLYISKGLLDPGRREALLQPGTPPETNDQ